MKTICQTRALCVVIFAATTMLANCSNETDTCKSAAYANLIGANIAAVTLPAGLNMRIVNETDLVTTDYVAERLNIEIDAQGNVQRVSCG